MFSAPLKSLILDIKNQSRMDNSILIDIVQANKLASKDIAPFMTFDHENTQSYGRKLIYDNGNFKILLMSWIPGDCTAIHDHGNLEWGCEHFFNEATHRTYKIENGELKIAEKDNSQTDQIASVSGDLIHLLCNLDTEKIATLHIYGSNTRSNKIAEGTKVYIPELKKVLTTMGSAYLNMNTDSMSSDMPFNLIGEDVLKDYYTLVKPFYERIKHGDILSEIDQYLTG